tara:strand:+ start:275 stop:1087 length:813 start_codon:yes stop_codon:yes gene_type:complete
MKLHIHLLFIIILSQIAFTQESFYKNKQTLIQLSNEIINSEADSIKKKASKIFKIKLLEIINQPKSYLLNFDQIDILSSLQPKDKSFKILTWFTPYNNGTYEYFGIIQTCKKNGKKCNIFNLSTIDLFDNILTDNLSINEWYGCMYYEIIPIKINKNIYYTLLGWDGNDINTTKKIIDVLKFTPNSPPTFGANIFNQEEKRIILEYNSRYPISLKYEKELDCIVYDHIKPIDELSTENFDLYAPNLSYDILQKSKNGWILEENIYLNNKK